MRIAVIGSGIAGLGAAYLLSREHHVDVFEREGRLGGHAHTHAIDLPSGPHRVDSGFLVYNTRTYPNFTRLLDELGVETRWSDMSFSVRCRRCGLEYGSRGFGSLFAQRQRLVDVAHWRLLAGIGRFFRAARRFLDGEAGHDVTLGEFFTLERVHEGVVRHFVLPMTAAIWSASSDDLRAFPARSILQFLSNHGLLAATGAPRWRTIAGGSQEYVRALAARISGRVHTDAPACGVERNGDGVVLRLASGERPRYDKVVLGTHADEALRLLVDPSVEEHEGLGCFRYSTNEAVLHTDDSVLPSRTAAWASWNCELRDCRDGRSPVSLTYHVNRLQSIAGTTQVCVTLNPEAPICGQVLARMSYTHPILDAAAVAAQPRVTALNGTRHTYFCGAHLRYGFHEDGFVSALQVAKQLGITWP